MLRRLPVFLLPFLLLSPSVGHGAPSNYDECILDSMKGVSSDVAARAIIESCRNLFSDSAVEAAPLAAPVPVTAPDARDAAMPAAPAAASVDPAPPDRTAARRLTADELAMLRSRAKVFGSTYRVRIENENPELTLTEVTIAVWDDADSAAGRKEYSEAVDIPPHTSAEVKYAVHYRGDETAWRWGVVAARGVE